MYLTVEQTKKIIDGRPKDSSPEDVLNELKNRGYTIQGLNDQQEQSQGDGIVPQIAKGLYQGAVGSLITRPVARATEAVTRLAFPNSEAAKGYELMEQQGESQRILGTDVAPVGQSPVRQIVGETIEAGSYLAPYGKIAAAGKAATGSATAGKAIAGATGGYASDVGTSLQDKSQTVGQALAPGVGTAVGAAVPVVGKAIKAARSATAPIGEKIQATGVGTTKMVTPVSKTEAIRSQKAEAGFGAEPITVADTMVRHNIGGRRTSIGVQAEKAQRGVWKDSVAPALESGGDVDMKKFFSDVEENIIKSNPELTRRNTLLEALSSIKDEYKDIPTKSLKDFQDLKAGWADPVPEKAYRGEYVSSAINEVRDQLSSSARRKIYDTLGPDVKTSYIDYGNLNAIKDIGITARTERQLRGGTGGVITELLGVTVTPIGTIAGKSIYKFGGLVKKIAGKDVRIPSVEIVGEPGAKTFGDLAPALGITAAQAKDKNK